MRDPIKLFWWRGAPNFGDAISPAIVSHVSGRPVVWAPRHEAELFSTGSVIDAALDLRNRPPPDASKALPWVWGSGALLPFEPASNNATPTQVRIALVRGPLTALMLNWQARSVGDPGLLVGHVTGVTRSRSPRYRAGLVLHHSQTVKPEVVNLLAARGVLSMTGATDDYRSIIEQIADCAVILSSSLHGLVFADALGIPNTWLVPDAIHRAARFKFHDYACAIGRVLDPPADGPRLEAVITALTGSQPAYFARIPALIESIRQSFPADLRAVAASTPATRPSARVPS